MNKYLEIALMTPGAILCVVLAPLLVLAFIPVALITIVIGLAYRVINKN